MRYFLVTILLVSFSTGVFAFGPKGHRITGAIAEPYLTSKSRRAIEWIIGNDDLAKASTYADEMRSNHSDFWQKQAGYYHYVTVPEGKRYSEVGAPEQGDAVTALNDFSETLRNKQASREEKALALRFIVHIIGDLHQPLHVGNGTDRGGNEFKVVFFQEESNLHRVWDSGLINRQQPGLAKWSRRLSKSITIEQRKAWGSTDPEVWIAESAGIRDKVYPHDSEISQDYQDQYFPVLEIRLQQAGVRMALYLNEIFE